MKRIKSPAAGDVTSTPVTDTKTPAKASKTTRPFHNNDGFDVNRPRQQAKETASVIPLTKKPPSPHIGRISLATADDMQEVQRIQQQHGFDPTADDPPPAGGWLLGMPSLLELQDSATCEQHAWVAKDVNDPERVIGSFAVAAPFTMSRPLTNHKFVVPLPPSIDAAFRGFNIRYVSRVMVDEDPRYARSGIMHTMFSEVLNSDVYQQSPCLAHIAIDPPNAASEGFFRAQGWKLIGYTSNHADPKRNTGLPVSDEPVIGGLWLLPPPGVFIPEVEGTAAEVVANHPVVPGESFERFVPRRHATSPPKWATSIGGFLEYGSMLREARNFARSGRDKLAERRLVEGETVFERVPEPQVDGD